MPEDGDGPDPKGDDDQPKLPSGDSIAGKVIQLKQVKQTIPLSLEIMLTDCQDHEVHRLEIVHLTEKALSVLRKALTK